MSSPLVSQHTSHYIQTHLPQNLLQQASEDARDSYDIYNGYVSTDDKTELFLMTDQLLDGREKDSQYRCAVKINHDTKQITFVTCGTRIGHGHANAASDLKDDAYMALGWSPSKFNSAKALNQLVLDQLGSEAGQYSFHYTGHSLGAALSDMAATDMALALKAKGLETQGKISTITFENPGSQYLIAKMLQASDLDLDALTQIVNFVTINNRPNFINTMDEHVGDTYYLIPEEQWGHDPLLKLIGYVGQQMPSNPLSKLLEFISHGSPSEQVKGHGMANFIDVFQRDEHNIKIAGGYDIPLDHTTCYG